MKNSRRPKRGRNGSLPLRAPSSLAVTDPSGETRHSVCSVRSAAVGDRRKRDLASDHNVAALGSAGRGIGAGKNTVVAELLPFGANIAVVIGWRAPDVIRHRTGDQRNGCLAVMEENTPVRQSNS